MSKHSILEDYNSKRDYRSHIVNEMFQAKEALKKKGEALLKAQKDVEDAQEAYDFACRSEQRIRTELIALEKKLLE